MSSTPSSTPASTNGRLARYLPIAGWLPRYERKWLRVDLFAGATLAAYAIPNAIAYALLAGLPSQAGLYGYIACGIAYALFGTSKQLAVGPTTAISLSIAAGLGAMALADPARYVALASTTALLVAAISFGAWLLRGGGIVHFISETVLTGFKIGAGLAIAASQLPKLLGISAGKGGFFPTLAHVAQHLGETNGVALALGLGGLAFIVVGRKLLPGKPITLIVVVLSIVLMFVTDLEARGVRTCGAIAAGLPHVGFPLATTDEFEHLLPIAFACFLLAYVEGVAAARTFAAKHGDRIDVNQELLALSAANLFAGAAQSYPCAGGMGQSTVNDSAGAKTPLSLAFCSAIVALGALFFTGALEKLPLPILAVLVLVPVRGLVQVAELRHLVQVSRKEFLVAMAALSGVLVLGILPGVMIAAVLSLVFLLQRAAYPSISVLGRRPGSDDYRDIDRHPECGKGEDALVVRPNAPLVYFNADVVTDAIFEKAMARAAKPRMVVIDLSYSEQIDVPSIRALSGLRTQLAAQGIEMRLAEVHHSARERLVAEGLGSAVGLIERRVSIQDVVGARAQA